MSFSIAAAIIIGYLPGSVPIAYIMARFTDGIDIRERGSGNVSALIDQEKCMKEGIL